MPKAPAEEQNSLRLKLRGLLAQFVERIDVAPYEVRQGKRRIVEAVIKVSLRQCPVTDWITVDTGTLDAPTWRALIVETAAEVAAELA